MNISFNRCIRDVDLIIIYERRDTMKDVKVCENSILQNRFGGRGSLLVKVVLIVFSGVGRSNLLSMFTRTSGYCVALEDIKYVLFSFGVKVVCRKMYNYVRYDLKEIAFPSSLPDPAHIKKRRKLTWHERFLVLKEASRLYAASWVRDIGPDLRPNDYKKDDVTEGKSNGNKSRSTETELSTLEDIAIAARGGMETLRPALQRLYMTRASAYRDALKSFIEGYQEGIQQVMEKNEDSSKA
ncbi:hypothetical protein CXB51_004527 [Gossypium anomalum]|uniref:Embryo defective 2735 n=1 Tax=Gossypium anomalum TaxID=47600 RepID=A0A8J5Z3I1_9ROSI|nr:hypothetical protein CXB51_004527 [Gossypium anomalum]